MRTRKLMGCRFELCIESEDAVFAEKQLDIGIEEIQRLEHLLSEFLPESDTSRINTAAGKTPVNVHPETLDLIQRSVRISALSQGYFDITSAPLKALYQFKNTGFKLPEKSSIRKMLKKTGYQKLSINPENASVALAEQGMKISFAAIGKGYASDAVKKIWLQNGVQSGYVNSSGDMNVISYQKPWHVAIAHPDNKDNVLLHFPLRDVAVATSGDYEQHFMYQNKRYSHNINPHTGYPVTGIKSVTVISPGAELSDALATAVYAMGVEKGLQFINQLPDTHVIIVNEENQVFFSEKINPKL